MSASAWLRVLGLLFRLLLQGLVVPLLIIAGCVWIVPGIVLLDRFELPAVVATVAVFAYLFGLARWYSWRSAQDEVPNARARYRA